MPPQPFRSFGVPPGYGRGDLLGNTNPTEGNTNLMGMPRNALPRTNTPGMEVTGTVPRYDPIGYGSITDAPPTFTPSFPMAEGNPVPREEQFEPDTHRRIDTIDPRPREEKDPDAYHDMFPTPPQ